MRRLVPALAASAALALAGVGAIAAQANAATTANPAFNIDGSPLYVEQGGSDTLVYSDPNSQKGDTYTFHINKASLKGVTAKGDSSQCTNPNATTEVCTNSLGGKFNTSFDLKVAANAPQDSAVLTAVNNRSKAKATGYVYTGRVADLDASQALQTIVFPNNDGTLQGGGLTIRVPNNGRQSTAAKVTLQAIDNAELLAKPKGLNCPTFSSGTIVCNLQNVPANSDSVKITFPVRFTAGETHTFALRFTNVGSWDSEPGDNIPHIQGDKPGQVTYRAPGAAPTTTPTATSTTPTTPTTAPTATSTSTSTVVDPTSSVSLPTNVPAGVAGPTDSNGGSSMGGPIALGAGILGLLMVGAAALRRRGSHQA